MTPSPQPPSISPAVEALSRGNQTEAKEICHRLLQETPEHPQALLVLGIIAYQSGVPVEAIRQIKRAVAAKPDFTDGHLNLGNIYLQHEQWVEAEASFRQVLSLQPDHAMALLSLAKILTATGQLEEAMEPFGKLLTLAPNDPDVHFNLGRVFAKADDPVQAMKAFNNALALKPAFPEALDELGLVQLDRGELEQARTCFEKALEMAPDNVHVLSHLGVAYKDAGLSEKALAIFRRALSLTPDDPVIYNYILLALQGLCFDVHSGLRNSADIDDFIAALPTPPEPEILTFTCAAVSSGDRLKAWDSLVRNFPSSPSMSNPHVSSANMAAEPASITALLHLGRSGTGYLHSLIDDHPQVSTLPGVYLSGFFGRDVWNRICAKGFEGMVEEFCRLHDVLFDARSPHPIPPAYISDKYSEESVGLREGFVEMGENRDTPLVLDRDAFTENLRHLIRGYEAVSQGHFFNAVHQAFEKTLGRTGKTNVFYHLHKMDPYYVGRYLQEFPNSQFLMTVRSPLQSCESWALPDRKTGEEKSAINIHDGIAKKISSMLLSLDAPIFRTHKSVGLRLEDLKARPEETIRQLAIFLGIEETPSLYQSTMQGLKWWGEPSSSLYGRTHDTESWEDDPLTRKPGLLFSESDQFILGTLFYPFSVQFGYVEKNDAQFRRDLKEIRPLLERPMDFERELSTKFPDGYPILETTGSFKALHAVLLGRWKVLDEQGTYPGLLTPLGH